MALSDFYSSRGNTRTRLVLSIRDSRGDVVDAAAAAKAHFSTTANVHSNRRNPPESSKPTNQSPTINVPQETHVHNCVTPTITTRNQNQRIRTADPPPTLPKWRTPTFIG
ncbi:hypothetical protein M0R45_001145 [Rubus argutus]|uniref:Uncharacterized protein n=1 Tax=Rubus argutus TaxID=59490 RepID=A0AAW1VLF1_RUBAR